MSSSLFIEISAASPDASDDAGDVAHAIAKHIVHQHYEADIVDEQYWKNVNEFKARTFKVAGISLESFQESTAKSLKLNLRPEVNLLMLMCSDNDANLLKDDELVIEHISPDMYVESLMVSRKDCGVVVTHLPTGISARCTGHRSRINNQIDALSMLGAKLRELKNQSSTPAAQASAPARIDT